MSKTTVRFNVEKFRQIREAQGFTPTSLAREADISSGTIRSWEKKVSTPSIETLAIVMDVLNHSPQEVIDVDLRVATLADLRTLAICPSQDAASALGLSLSGYSALERGALMMTPDRAAILSHLFGVTSHIIYEAWARNS